MKDKSESSKLSFSDMYWLPFYLGFPATPYQTSRERWHWAESPTCVWGFVPLIAPAAQREKIAEGLNSGLQVHLLGWKQGEVFEWLIGTPERKSNVEHSVRWQKKDTMSSYIWCYSNPVSIALLPDTCTLLYTIPTKILSVFPQTRKSIKGTGG